MGFSVWSLVGGENLSDINGFYDSKLKPIINELEKERKKIKQKGIKFLLIPLVTLIILSLIIALNTGMMQILIVVFIISFIILAIAYNKITGPYVDNFKTKVISKLVEFVDRDLEYDHNNYIDEMTFKESRLYEHRIDDYDGEDYIGGMVGKTHIEFSEVLARYKTETHTKNGTRTTWHTLFDGLFFSADFNKKFTSDLIIKPDLAEKWFGNFGKKLQKLNVFQHGQLIELEDPDFEREFKVYGTDQTEARYILTPVMMEKILQLNSKILMREQKRISLSFINSRLYLALPLNKNLFEPSIFGKEVVREQDILDYYEYIKLMTNIVDDLDLNTRIWMKQ